ncbi:MAG: hypothetical protein U0R71_12015 [Solirubrobacterales bacterium]
MPTRPPLDRDDDAAFAAVVFISGRARPQPRSGGAPPAVPQSVLADERAAADRIAAASWDRAEELAPAI